MKSHGPICAAFTVIEVRFSDVFVLGYSILARKGISIVCVSVCVSVCLSLSVCVCVCLSVCAK